MRHTTSLERFAADPVGACLVGTNWIHWSAGASLFGVVLWDRPSEESIQALVRSLAVELQPGIAPHQSLVDASRVTSVDGAAFMALGDYLQRHHEALAGRVTRLALVRPDGIAGAVTSGFFEVMGMPYPVSIFRDAEGALEWLDPAGSTEVLRELDALHLAQAGLPSLVASLSLLLAENLAHDAASAARALGMSERSLQRRLQELGTTYGNELNAARLREAERLMLDSDLSLSRIARTVGFSSPQRFSTAFRLARGETPNAWRARQRR